MDRASIERPMDRTIDPSNARSIERTSARSNDRPIEFTMNRSNHRSNHRSIQCKLGLRNSLDLTRLSAFLKNWTSAGPGSQRRSRIASAVEHRKGFCPGLWCLFSFAGCLNPDPASVGKLINVDVERTDPPQIKK